MQRGEMRHGHVDYAESECSVENEACTRRLR